jgi:hypothetical protein
MQSFNTKSSLGTGDKVANLYAWGSFATRYYRKLTSQRVCNHGFVIIFDSHIARKFRSIKLDDTHPLHCRFCRPTTSVNNDLHLSHGRPPEHCQKQLAFCCERKSGKIKTYAEFIDPASQAYRLLLVLSFCFPLTHQMFDPF